MRIPRFAAAVAAPLLATAALAGPYDQPYALLETGKGSEVRKESPIAIIKVDGQSTRNPRKPDPVPPGKHTLTLHFESARGVFRPEYRDVEIDLEPCTRYSIVAAYGSKTGPDWTPRVFSEPIGECLRKFAKKGAPGS